MGVYAKGDFIDKYVKFSVVFILKNDTPLWNITS